jgi:hypothetical protein
MTRLASANSFSDLFTGGDFCHNRCETTNAARATRPDPGANFFLETAP